MLEYDAWLTRDYGGEMGKNIYSSREYERKQRTNGEKKNRTHSKYKEPDGRVYSSIVHRVYIRTEKQRATERTRTMGKMVDGR